MLWFLGEQVDCLIPTESREMEPSGRPVGYAGIMDNRERSMLHRIEGSENQNQGHHETLSFRTGIGNGRGKLEMKVF